MPQPTVLDALLPPFVPNGKVPNDVFAPMARLLQVVSWQLSTRVGTQHAATDVPPVLPPVLVPAGQAVHAVAPGDAAYVSRPHAVHDVPVPLLWNIPAGQRSQLYNPDVALSTGALPAGHAGLMHFTEMAAFSWSGSAWARSVRAR